VEVEWTHIHHRCLNPASEAELREAARVPRARRRWRPQRPWRGRDPPSWPASSCPRPRPPPWSKQGCRSPGCRRLSRVVEPLSTVATAVSVLQVCAVLAQACNPLVCTSCRCRPCHVVPWKIRAAAPTETMMVEPLGGICLL
jgi:hypothetical protein